MCARNFGKRRGRTQVVICTHNKEEGSPTPYLFEMKKAVMNLVDSVLCEEGCEFYKGRNKRGYIVCEKYGVLLNCPWNLMHQRRSEKDLTKFWNDAHKLIMPLPLKITSTRTQEK